MPTPEALTRELSRRVRELQSKARLPSVSAAVSRGGEVIWSEAVGLAQVDGGVEATPDTQYRVGSITKTFTAMAIMQLRDAGELALDDRLGDHIPEAAHPGPTIRRMLAHSSGLQREPTGDLWESMQAPSVEQLLSTLEEAEQVLEPGRWFHYSNLAFCLLGEVVSRRGGMPYRRFVQERILDPVGLSRTTWDPTEPVGHGYFVEPYMDGVRRELDDVDLEGAASAGQLWSTTEDLCRWGAFLSDPDPAVIAPASVDDMHTVQVMTDDGWHQAWGLGLALTREGERIVGGHSGGMPGFITCFAYSRKERVVATALTNGLFDMEPITHKLLAAVADAFPGEPETWKPGTKPPAAVADILGRWWSEGEEYIFSWRGDRLVGMPAYQPSDDDRAVFVSEGDDRFRVESGRERGEVLRVIRGADGVPEKLYWATYPFRREPFTFGELLRQ